MPSGPLGVVETPKHAVTGSALVLVRNHDEVIGVSGIAERPADIRRFAIDTHRNGELVGPGALELLKIGTSGLGILTFLEQILAAS